MKNAQAMTDYNAQRTATAAEDMIRRVSEALTLLGRQAPPLYAEAARLRAAYPQDSLASLADRAGVTKDVLSGRLRRLLALAADMAEARTLAAHPPALVPAPEPIPASQKELLVNQSPAVLAPFRPPEPTGTGRNGTLPPACEAEVMTITPELAREWADLNTRNRKVRYARVALLARDMAAGKWILNGETIKIAADGTILDGQHRLYACIQADVPFQTVVIRGLPAEAQDTIDTGLTRRMSDQFTIHGEKHAGTLAATARWLFKWQLGIRTGTGRGNTEPTHEEMTGLLAAEPRLRDAAAWAESARSAFRSVNPAVYGIAWFLFSELDEAAAGEFLGAVVTGENLAAGDPALAFRNRIWKARETGEKFASDEQLAYLILAWNAFREGRTLARLRLPNGTLTAKNFPEPK